ncbi:cytidylyltransferase [Podospora conica]|nr:cytidylyltransferase [Schizothecium conicum]
MPPPTPTPIASGSNTRTIITFFSRALLAFQNSTSPFQVICTLGPTTTPTSTPPASISSATRPKTLIVLDSSFNPPTLAHLRMATSAVLANTPNSTVRLLLLLSVQNADKPVKPASFAQRLAMMYVFAGDVQARLRELEGAMDEGVVVDIGLTTKPYFHDKSRAIAESGAYGSPGPEQVVLVGFDTLIRIFDQKYYGGKDGMREEVGGLLGRARLRVMMRPGDEWGDVEAQRGWVQSLEEERWKERIEMVQGRSEGERVVSSTLARNAAKMGDWEVLRGLVTEGVVKVVREEGLYKEG